jgi:hypothetical protein
VEAPNSRPNNTPVMTAFTVNSAGDWDADTYGWNPVCLRAGMAIGPDISTQFLLQSPSGL